MQRYCHIDSPLGPLLVAGDDQGLTCLSFPSGSKTRGPDPQWIKDDTPFKEVRTQLDAYFDGTLQAFDLPLNPPGTVFQREVQVALQTIGYGETRSYAQIAQQIGRPKAVRAVGAANGANPIAIIIPCHRVIGANRSLTGFGGGLPAKVLLLKREGISLPEMERMDSTQGALF